MALLGCRMLFFFLLKPFDFCLFSIYEFISYFVRAILPFRPFWGVYWTLHGMLSPLLPPLLTLFHSLQFDQGDCYLIVCPPNLCVKARQIRPLFKHTQRS